MTRQTTTERISDTELLVTRHFDAPPHLVYEAWTTADLMRRWWVPASFGMTMLECEIDARTGGTYRFVFQHPAFDQPMAFHGRYVEATPPTRIVWTNEEDPNGSVTTVTLHDMGDGTTRLVLHDVYPTKEAADEAIASGATGAYPEQFDALDALLSGG
jgi:uncharacterized protein YndB with AHSA1/START domain